MSRSHGFFCVFVCMILLEPVGLDSQNVGQAWPLIPCRGLLDMQTLRQRSNALRSETFSIQHYSTYTTCGQYLALSKGWRCCLLYACLCIAAQSLHGRRTMPCTSFVTCVSISSRVSPRTFSWNSSEQSPVLSMVIWFILLLCSRDSDTLSGLGVVLKLWNLSWNVLKLELGPEICTYVLKFSHVFTI